MNRSLFEDLPPLQANESMLRVLGVRPEGDDESHVAAVWPFFAQFVAHDITAVPRANLESLYGEGPTGSPHLYRTY